MPRNLTTRRGMTLLGLVALSIIAAAVGVWMWVGQHKVEARLADVEGVIDVGLGPTSELVPDSPPPNQVLLPRSVDPETLAGAYAEIEEIREESGEQVQTFVGPVYVPSGITDGVDRLAYVVSGILDVDDVADAVIHPGSAAVDVEVPDADSAAEMLPIASRIARTLESDGPPEYVEGQSGGFIRLFGADPEAADEDPPVLQFGVEDPATAGRLLRQLARGVERSGGHLEEVLLLNQDEAAVIVRWKRPSEAKQGARALENAFDEGLELDVAVAGR